MAKKEPTLDGPHPWRLATLLIAGSILVMAAAMGCPARPRTAKASRPDGGAAVADPRSQLLGSPQVTSYCDAQAIREHRCVQEGSVMYETAPPSSQGSTRERERFR